jgi:hypothetical protein
VLKAPANLPESVSNIVVELYLSTDRNLDTLPR